MSSFDFRNFPFELADNISLVGEVRYSTPWAPLEPREVEAAAAHGVLPQLLAYGQGFNGFVMKWEATADRSLQGHIGLQRLHQLFGRRWQGPLVLPHERPHQDARLPAYRPVDVFSTEHSVGLLQDERQSPELYHYAYHRRTDQDEFCSTGLDLVGYLELLRVSLGLQGWTSLLAELGSAAGQARPYHYGPGPHGRQAEAFVTGLARLVPGFTLAQFVARYDQVKLPAAQRWQAQPVPPAPPAPAPVPPLAYDFAATADEVSAAIDGIGTLLERTGPSPLTAAQLARAAAHGVPAPYLAYGQAVGGYTRIWQAHHDPEVSGCIGLQSALDMFSGAWEGVIYFDDTDSDDPRLPDFCPLDNFSDAAFVGLFHDAYRSPELFCYHLDDSAPAPTGVDLLGYLELLRLTLGLSNWPWLLVELAAPEGQARPFRPRSNSSAEYLAEQLAHLVPGFTLEQFVARYDAVKLPAARTWAGMGGEVPAA